MPVILLETPAVFFKNPALDIVIASTGILSEISVLPSNGFLVLNRCAIAKQLGGVGVGTLYRVAPGCSKTRENVFGTR